MGRRRRRWTGCAAALMLCIVCLQGWPIADGGPAVLDELVDTRDLVDLGCCEVAITPASTSPALHVRRDTASSPLYQADVVRAKRWGS